MKRESAAPTTQAPQGLSVLHRLFLGGTLLTASSLAWAISAWHDLTAMQSVLPADVMAFLALWTVMMVAMMFPSLLPAVLLFAVAARSRSEFGVRPAPAWLFVAGFIMTWVLAGVFPFTLSRIIAQVTTGVEALRAWSGLGIPAALILAGLYQFTRWKSLCLSHCRSPVQLIHSWRDGPVGALWMGAAHGTYCIGCCWGLMLVLLVLGAMNLAWMGLVAFVIFVEKVTPIGVGASRVAGIALVLGGLLTAAGLLRTP